MIIDSTIIGIPSDVVIKVERKKGRPTGGLSKESSAAGGKKARRTTTKYTPTDDDYKKVEEMVLLVWTNILLPR